MILSILLIWKPTGKLIQEIIPNESVGSLRDIGQAIYGVISLKSLSNQQLPDPNVENVKGTVKPRQQQLSRWLDLIVVNETGHRATVNPRLLLFLFMACDGSTMCASQQSHAIKNTLPQEGDLCLLEYS